LRNKKGKEIQNGNDKVLAMAEKLIEPVFEPSRLWDRVMTSLWKDTTPSAGFVELCTALDADYPESTADDQNVTHQQALFLIGCAVGKRLDRDQ
jgi:hypothetical protein